MHFVTYPTGTLPDLSGYTILTPDAPPLVGDEKGLFLIDGTWRYADKMKKVLPEGLTYRSIPSGYQTAYPRRQDESAGLASIEALYIAYLLTGRDPTFLLENYHWKENFLKLNAL